MSRVYPLMSITADFTQGPPNIPGNSGVQLLPATAAGNNPACRGWSTTRGRQYELDVVQAGTASLDVVDPAEWLNPVNTASPWNSGANSLLPYRCTQIAAWWNGTTLNTAGNLLNSTNTITGSTATYDPSFEAGGLGGWFGIAGAPTLVSSTAQHFAGAKSVSITYNAGGDVAAVALPATVPGQLWTFSLYVFVPASHTVTASLYNFPTGAPLASATSSTTGAWQRLTLSGTPTTRYAIVQLAVASGTTPTTVFIDAMQLEFAASASAFTTSGPTFYEVYTGYIERYPQLWDSQGFRGLRPLEAVDALSVLSRTTISQSYAKTVLADGPSVFVPYDDDSFPQVVQRLTGGQPMAPYQQVGSQSASISFGGDSFPDGSKAISMSQQNTDPVTNSDSTQITYLGTRQGAFALNPQSFAIEAWYRFSSGQFFFGGGSMASGATTIGVPAGPPAQIGWKTFANAFSVIYGDTNNALQINRSFLPLIGSAKYADPYWHHVTISLLGSNTYQFSIDGILSSVATFLNPTPPSMQIDNIYFDVTTYYGDPLSTAAIAKLAMYSAPLTSAQVAKHYQRGIGYLGEKSGVRALRLLTQYWSTNVVTDTGVTSMAPDFSYSGRAMLDVLQEIADTERGLVWADAAGVVHQDSRETRYVATTSATSQFTFGENSGAGELPYEELEYDYDPTFVFSEADLTAGGSGTQLPAIVNATSQTAYGQKTLSKTLQMATDWDVNQAGLFYVQRYAKPAGAAGTGVPPRVSKMTLNPAANPALFTAVLSMDIGTRITVKRRTSAVTISGDYYVEQINHDATGDASSWKTELQVSPVFVSQPWILGDATKSVLGSTTVCVY